MNANDLPSGLRIKSALLYRSEVLWIMYNSRKENEHAVQRVNVKESANTPRLCQSLIQKNELICLSIMCCEARRAQIVAWSSRLEGAR